MIGYTLQNFTIWLKLYNTTLEIDSPVRNNIGHDIMISSGIYTLLIIYNVSMTSSVSGKTKKIAVVYDWIDKWGGVERLLLILHEEFPEADFYTSYYNKKRASWAKDLSIKTSFIQKLPGFIKQSRLLSLLLYPFAFESFDFSGYDMVISVSSSFAKGVITKPETLHISYLLTPTRFLWGQSDDYLKGIVKKIGSALFGSYLRKWDYVAAQRPDKIASISKLVADRTLKYYRRESVVLNPPFDIPYWTSIKEKILVKESFGGDEKYYLLVSRLESYKRVDLVIQTFNKLGKKLIIVGTGSEEAALNQNAGKNVVFMKNTSDVELGKLYTYAEALIMPQEEDFGYVALEALFFACPVLSYSSSGAKEIVVDNETGLFFMPQSQEALTATIERYEKASTELKQSLYQNGKELVEKYSKEHFLEQFQRITNEYSGEKT